MFLKGFAKLATTLVTMTPEEYFEVVREKDPFVGSVLGGVAGGVKGALKGTKKTRHKAALIGTGVGGAAGAAAGYVGGKALRHYQAKKVRRIADELNLRATPQRHRDR